VPPLAGVVALALERLEALVRRHVGGRQSADRGDDKASRHHVALVGAHCPKLGAFVEYDLDDPLAELDVGLEVEAFGAMLEIAQDLILLRIALGPVPLLQQVFVERVAIDVAIGIAACAGIAIPVPGAADPVAGLEHGDVEVELVAQRMQHVHAGKSGADDDGIELRFRASPL
jgi:hypothetical protein